MMSPISQFPAPFGPLVTRSLLAIPFPQRVRYVSDSQCCGSEYFPASVKFSATVHLPSPHRGGAVEPTPSPSPSPPTLATPRNVKSPKPFGVVWTEHLPCRAEATTCPACPARKNPEPNPATVFIPPGTRFEGNNRSKRGKDPTFGRSGIRVHRRFLIIWLGSDPSLPIAPR